MSNRDLGTVNKNNTKKLYKFWEVIKILTEESNHYNHVCFEHIHSGLELYRHKGYLTEGVNGIGQPVTDVCFDDADDYVWSRKW